MDLVGKTIGGVCKALDLKIDVAALGKDGFVVHDPLHEIQTYEPYIREELRLGKYDGALARIVIDMWYPQYTDQRAAKPPTEE